MTETQFFAIMARHNLNMVTGDDFKNVTGAIREAYAAGLNADDKFAEMHALWQHERDEVVELHSRIGRERKRATDAVADAHCWRWFSNLFEFVWNKEDGRCKWVRWVKMPQPDISEEGLRTKGSGVQQLEAFILQQTAEYKRPDWHDPK